jgi:REP element-mobilizing transposase RayT
MAGLRQLTLALARPIRRRSWGGKRKGAGRPRTLGRVELAHRSRESFSKASPLHVTLRTAPGTYNLRSRRSANALKLAIFGGADRFGVRVVQLSVQGNHLHLLVEAPDQVALGRAMKGLGVRIARRMNAMMGRSGRVIGDRYHARRLKTPTEVRNAMHYIRYNHQHHGLGRGVDECSSDGLFEGLVVPARLWLVTVGWKRARGSPRVALASAAPRTCRWCGQRRTAED